MKIIYKNLMPQDTRAGEIISAVTLVILSIVFFLDSSLDTQLFAKYSNIFWGVYSGIVGLIQLYGLLKHPDKLNWRIVGLWMAGSFWALFAFSGDMNIIRIVAGSVVSFYCFIFFIINLIIAGENRNKNKKRERLWNQ